MAKIDVELLVDSDLLAKDVSSGNFKSSDVKKYIRMQDNQPEDVYIDDNEDDLFIHAGRGDEMTWTIKTKSGDPVTFEKFEIKIKSIFKGNRGVPVLDPTGTKFTGTVAENAKHGAVVKYTLVINSSKLKVKLIHDPYIEIKPFP